MKLAGTNFCLDAGSKPANGVKMKVWTVSRASKQSPHRADVRSATPIFRRRLGISPMTTTSPYRDKANVWILPVRHELIKRPSELIESDRRSEHEWECRTNLGCESRSDRFGNLS